jgi:hypothetical protein
MKEQTKEILIWAFILSTVIVCVFACKKDKVKPQPKAIKYENTIAEAFRVLDTCGIRELEMLNFQALSDYEEIQWRSLEDSLSTQSETFCISRKVDQGPKTYYMESGILFLNFLSVYGSEGPNYWDIDGDQDVNTRDLINLLTAYGQSLDIQPNFADYDIFDSFGEGNTWLEYTGQDSTIEFGWLHRTPYDEVSWGNYLGYNLYSYTIDVVRLDSVVFYEYIRP